MVSEAQNWRRPSTNYTEPHQHRRPSESDGGGVPAARIAATEGFFAVAGREGLTMIYFPRGVGRHSPDKRLRDSGRSAFSASPRAARAGRFCTSTARPRRRRCRSGETLLHRLRLGSPRRLTEFPALAARGEAEKSAPAAIA